MPVSPVVRQHQESIVQQSTTPEQLSYNKEFGEIAYKLLNSKYPRLVPYTITFKILEGGDADNKDYGVGSFIIARGDTINYVPVVLQGGSIVSCEMVYDKEEETFRPLCAKEVKAIVDENRIKEHTTIKTPRTEDTKQVFTNMFRPPASSNPILASTRVALDILPDEAKETLSQHLQDNPRVLAKIASFYDAQVLAERLTCSAGHKEGLDKQAGQSVLANQAEDYAYMDKVIKLDELTEKTAEAVQAAYPELVDDLIDKGYVVVNTEEEVVVEAIPSDKFYSEVETSFNAFQVGGDQNNSLAPGTANVLKVTDDGYIKQIRCLVTGNNQLLHPEFYMDTRYESIVLSDYKEGITRQDIHAIFGDNMYSPEGIVCMGDAPHPQYQGIRYKYEMLIPGKCGFFKAPKQRVNLDSLVMFVQVDSPNNTTVTAYAGNSKVITFTSAIEKGCLEGILPLKSVLLKVAQHKALHSDCIYSLPELRRILENSSIKLRYYKDGPDHNLINRSLDKTAQFKSEADMIRYAVDTYHMDKTAALALLEHKKIHLVKTANAMEMAQRMAGPSGNPAVPMGSSEQPSPGMWDGSSTFNREQEPLIVDESLLEDMADFGDEDLMDTGMIASLAGNDDIKSLLVDFVQDFEGTVTELAKAVLIMVVNQDDFKEQYGREEYSSILGKLRSVFTGLGGIVFDLNEFVNNQSFNEGL